MLTELSGGGGGGVGVLLSRGPSAKSATGMIKWKQLFLTLIGRLSRIRDIIYFTRGRMSHICDKIFMDALRS